MSFSSRLRNLVAVALIGLSLSGCGYNTIPTAEETPRRDGPRCRTSTSAAPT